MSERYSRQSRLLPELGGVQSRLTEARVCIIGCGGLGAPVIQYLAAAGVGRLTLWDGDQVELSNLNRQTLFAPDQLDMDKASAAAQFARRLNPEIEVLAGTDFLDEAAMRAEFADNDLVIDCVDKLATKFLISAVAVTEDVPLIHGACTGTGGQMMVIPGAGGPCLRCVFEEEPGSDVIHSGTRPGIIGAAAGTVGCLMATQAIKALLSAPEPGISQFHLIDAWKNTIKSIEIESREGCTCSA